MGEYESIVKSIRESFGAKAVVLVVTGGETGSGVHAEMDRDEARAVVKLMREWADKTEEFLDTPGPLPSRN